MQQPSFGANAGKRASTRLPQAVLQSNGCRSQKLPEDFETTLAAGVGHDGKFYFGHG